MHTVVQSRHGNVPPFLSPHEHVIPASSGITIHVCRRVWISRISQESMRETERIDVRLFFAALVTGLIRAHPGLPSSLHRTPTMMTCSSSLITTTLRWSSIHTSGHRYLVSRTLVPFKMSRNFSSTTLYPNEPLQPKVLTSAVPGPRSKELVRRHYRILRTRTSRATRRPKSGACLRLVCGNRYLPRL